jgi:soluble lytic murein transglycosylase
MSGRSRVVGAIAAALVLACGRTESAPAAPRAPEVVPVGSSFALVDGANPAEEGVPRGDAPLDAVASDPAAHVAWPLLVREQRWDGAWRALEALPEAERSPAEVRYVRARVALARSDAAAALPLLEGLEVALPLLAEDIAWRRATAKLAVGPFDEAGEWFAARPDADAQLEAGRAFEKANAPGRARLAADRVLRIGRRTRAQEAQARALRVRVVDPPGDEELADARWLATSGADVSPVDGVALLARIDPKRPLAADELLVRARVLSEAGRTDDALRAIELAAGAPGGDRTSELDRARARGNALFHARGRSVEAAKALGECAGAGGPHAAEDAFHAARALSRGDRDEEAIRGYQDVERRFPRSTWADDAAFFGPYLRMLHAEWQPCASGFDAYLRAHANGEHRRDARRDGGLCKLLGGDSKGARAAFERLRDDVPADPIGGARMADMAALAALRDGDRSHAVALWTDVARDHPLSWAALVARARLAEVGALVPPAIDPAPVGSEAGAPLVVPLPPPADFLQRVGLDGDAETAVRDRERAITGAARGRAVEALCAVYGEIGRARRRYQVAQAVPSVLLAVAPDARNPWAWNCVFPTPYADEVRAAETSEGLPAGLVWAVMRQESGFDPDAMSPARAVGLMQLLPETARPIADELAIAHDDATWTRPSLAIPVGARLLHQLIDRFHGHVPLAVAAYNAGAESVERWVSRAKGMQLDSFVERIPYDETRDYVSRVMGNLARYGYLARGEAGVPRIELALEPR